MPCSFDGYCPAWLRRFCETHTDDEMTREAFRTLICLCPHVSTVFLGAEAEEKWKRRIKK